MSRDISKLSSRSNLLEMMEQPLSSGASEYDELLLPELPPDYHTGFARHHLNLEEGLGGLPFSQVHQPPVPFNQARRDVYIPREAIVANIAKVERDYAGNLLSPFVYYVELAHDAPSLAQNSAAYQIMQLEKYLNAVLRSELRNNKETLAFLEISHLSFVVSMGAKLKEGMMTKRSGDARSAGGFCHTLCIPCRSICTSWQTRWVMLRDTYLAVIRPKDGVVTDVMLMDNKFDVQAGLYKTGRTSGIAMSNQTRKLSVASLSGREKRDEWLELIRHVMSTTAREFIVPNRFESFAPVRNGEQCQWFVDGEGYMKAVARALDGAREEIFITDWMLSAELFLVRPVDEGSKWRLDKILQRKAEEGVKIFVMLYKEVELALALNSGYTKNRLEQLHPQNIKVIRHPDHFSSGVLFWAHHEKMVVVDQTYAFLGGIDLCFGRWDNHQHRLVDLDEQSVSEKGINGDAGSKDPVVTVTHVANALQSARPPPNAELIEEGRRQSSRRKSQSHAPNSSDNRRPSSRGKPEVVVPSPPSPIMYNKNRVWHGKDYMNFIYKDFADLHLPFVDIVDRTSVVRMPWHDIGVVVQGKSARDVARHFIQRWNVAKFRKARNNLNYPILLPKSYENLDDIPPVVTRMKTVNCQILRSASGWSAGIKESEHSVHDAYIQAITEAKHFVYIENQFFISLTGNNYYVHNKIADAIFNRVIQAHRNREIFRVYVVLPLLPAFEGELGTGTGVAIQAVTHWNYSSMSQGPNSLYVRLAQKVGDPTNYLTFYALRTHDTLLGKPVSELVYVHSKMLIVDDLLVIIGSANINDRSMSGERDSELAVIVEDVDTFPSRMAERPFEAGKFAGSLRRHIFREHLGLIDEASHGVDVADPVSEHFFKGVWLRTAARNSKIFEEVFCCLPNDRMQTFAQMRQYMTKVPLTASNIEEARDRLRGVKGHLVIMPLQFLSQETLSPPAGSKESLLPTSLWT